MDEIEKAEIIVVLMHFPLKNSLISKLTEVKFKRKAFVVWDMKAVFSAIAHRFTLNFNSINLFVSIFRIGPDRTYALHSTCLQLLLLLLLLTILRIT